VVSLEQQRPPDAAARTSESDWRCSSAGESKNCDESSAARADDHDDRVRCLSAKSLA
jgi:hypothetical protein